MAKQKEQVEYLGKLNELKLVEEVRKSTGYRRVAFDFSNCPSRTEQHWIKDGDLNYLIAKYTPDELAMYVEARMARRPEIKNHDFSQEPDLMGAKNIIRQMKVAFEGLDPEIKGMFNSHTEFVRFIDNPANQEKMIRLGLMTKAEVAAVATPATPTPVVGEGAQGATRAQPSTESGV